MSLGQLKVRSPAEACHWLPHILLFFIWCDAMVLQAALGALKGKLGVDIKYVVFLLRMLLFSFMYQLSLLFAFLYQLSLLCVVLAHS